MRLVFLGTGSGWPTKSRNVSSIALEDRGDVLLMDCGEGTQRQILYTSISFMKISRILITHFHGDHILGIPGLIQSMALAGRERPLFIAGPQGVEDLVGRLLSLGDFRRTFEVHAVPMVDGDLIDTGTHIIRAAGVKHSIPTLAYSVEEKERPGRFDREKAISLGVPEGPLFGRLQRGESVTVNGRTIEPEEVMGPSRPGLKVVYSGDTAPSESMVKLSAGADVLIHEATFSAEMVEKALDFGHSTSVHAAEIAKRAGVKRLILTHISPRYEDASPLLNEAREVFEDVEIAEDFMEITLMHND